MSTAAQPAPTAETQRFHCLEIRGGSEAVEQALDLPGLEAFVFSRPHGGDDQRG